MDSSEGFALANGASQNITQEAVGKVCVHLGLLSCCDRTPKTTKPAAGH